MTTVTLSQVNVNAIGKHDVHMEKADMIVASLTYSWFVFLDFDSGFMYFTS